jgi:hypothetical protein
MAGNIDAEFVHHCDGFGPDVAGREGGAVVGGIAAFGIVF